MKYFSWSPEKNKETGQRQGRRLRGDRLSHRARRRAGSVGASEPEERYPGQRILVVNVEGYAYLVPFVEVETEVFLKTIIPSRKATRDYLGDS